MNNKYTNTFRLQQWWQPKAGNIFIIIFLASIITHLEFNKLVTYILPAIITIVGIGGFGHLINDFFDLESDKKTNKKNSLENKSNPQRILFISFSILLALAPWGFLPIDHFSIYLLTTEFVMLLLYAIPPFRFKTKGLLALVTDSLYAHVIPSILSFHTFVLISNQKVELAFYIIISIWQFFIGIHNILIHQLEDFENDTRSQINTFTTVKGKETTRGFLLRYIFPLHIISFVVFVIFIASSNNWYYVIVPLLYVLIYFYNIFKGKSFFYYLRSVNASDLQNINIHYHKFLLLWHVIILIVFLDVQYVALLLGIAVLFNFSLIKWLYFNSIYQLIKVTKNLIGTILNYSIYYFRRLVLFQNPEKARREYHAGYALKLADESIRKKSIHIAIANKNLTKYTETFIDSRRQKLAYFIHTIYGDSIPGNSDRKENLISSNESYRKYLNWKTSFFDLEETHFSKTAFKNYLLDNNIQLVLAEFGTTGVEIFELCKEIKVPLIVTFYGYDAFHKEVLDKHLTAYLEMFDYCSKIICVSKDIQKQLITLGADTAKTKYLPCTFFPDNFEYKDHSKNKNIFLAIGRFAETKSPHLTILAFNEVLKDIPDAQLVMIGKDGGGELFEACHILVKALKIEAKVDFKGILTPIEVKAEMDQAKVFVQHSLTTPMMGDKEGTPVAIMEAMANGLAIVATKHAGIQEIIEHGKTGVLVEEYDYLAMAGEMKRICLDTKLIKLLGENASKSIRSNPLISENIQILAELIEKYRLK